MSVLVLALVVINAVAIWSIVSSRKSAEQIAIQDLALQTTAHARSLEAVLSSRRGDLIFLSQSPPIANALMLATSQDPVNQRWSRLDIEGSLLLFLAAHSEVIRMVIRDAQDRPILAAGQRDGAPALLPANEFPQPAHTGPGLLVGSWPIRSADSRPGKLETVLSVARLLETAVPGLGPQFSLVQREHIDAGVPDSRGDEPVLAAIPVHDDGWPEPVRWIMACRESPSHLLGSLTELAGRYRTTVVLNLGIMALAIVLGVVGFGQLRKAMGLEAEKKQQERMQELERQVLHNERLASVGQLAAGMAHEINNPLEGMANYLSLLEEDLRASRYEDSVHLVCRIREGLERVAGVTRQVLTFADPGASPLIPIDLNSVLNDTVRFVRSNPAFRQTHVMINASREELRILGNRVTLGQLFLNLLMNACQVQPEGGQIEVASIKEGNRAIIIVADCGPGIPDHVLPKIFEPFYSTRGSTGLGLSVCYGIVEEHGGRIVAHNRLGGGAIFQVEFPLFAGAEAREAVGSI